MFFFPSFFSRKKALIPERISHSKFYFMGTTFSRHKEITKILKKGACE
jgi:hypothetical protein